MAEQNMPKNPWHDNSFLLRFMRARKFELPKCQEMFGNYMKYRIDNQLDTIITVSTFSLEIFHFFSYFRIINVQKPPKYFPITHVVT